MTAAAVPAHGAIPAADGLGRWGATLLLAACFALSYVDRQVMSLLVTPIKAAFGLTDGDVGLLQGISFSLFYVIAALPLAWAADRVHRPRLAAACVAVWSAMTIGCGLAQGFAQLMMARIGLAASEAGLPPAALTLMADIHDRRGLARGTSLFMLAPFVGGGLALFAGGALYAALDGAVLPWGMAPWRALFVLAGVPGLILAPLVAWLLVEPRAGARGVRAGGSARDLGRFVLGQWRFCIVYMLALALLVMVLNAHIAWMPTAILRRFAIGEARMGAGFGLVYLVAGSLGTLIAGWIVGRAADGDMLRRALRLMRAAALVLVPFAVAAPLAPGFGPTLLLAGIAVFCTSAVVSMGSIPLQLAVPHALRAQAIALSGLVAALLGTGLGPLVVGLASDAAAAAGFAQPLSAALAGVGGGAALLVALLMDGALRAAGSLDSDQRTAP